MRHARLSLVLSVSLLLTACATTSFRSTWKAPDARPVSARGEKVIALVVKTNEASRRVAEDALARELTRRGAEGIAAYTIPGSINVRNEAEIRAAFEKTGAVGVVVLRPVGKEKEVYESQGVIAD